MVRTYKRKTERGKTSESLLRQAANAVIQDGRKIKTVARELEICHMTLYRFVKKMKAGKEPTVGYQSRSVFNPEQEKELVSYILKCSSIYFGLLPGEVRKLAYECAVKFSLGNIPPTWHNNGKGWRGLVHWFIGSLTTKRRKRKSAVLTDTPEKNAFAEEQAKKKAKKNEDTTSKGKENKNNKGKGKGKGERKEKAKRRVLHESESDSNEDLEWYCIVCCDSYSNSLPREQWIECIVCKNWAHVKCINEAGITYVCPNCESDEELNDE